MLEKFDPNAPAFGEGAQKIEEATSEAVAEPVVETKEEETETSEEESKVPYSRFKKFHDEAKRYQREAEEWRAKAEAIKPNTESESAIDTQDEAYKLWIENFGDNETSRKAWQNQLKITKTLETRALERARESAIEAVRAEREEEQQRIGQNLEIIDNNFETLTDFVGRALTEKEQSALLDIVDDYTPKDEDGNYAGPVMPFEKAWEIYELKQSATKAPKIASRNNVASLTSSQSEGEPNAKDEQNKNWNPFDWDAYKKRM